MTDIQYISDAKGNPVGVIVPIEIWQEIEAEQRAEKTSKDNFWLAASESSLDEIWNNEEDDVYAELLKR